MPRVPLPDVGVTSIRETCTASSEDITPRSSLLRTHAPIPCGSPLLRLLASFEESSQVATSPCCYRDSPDVISANLSPDAWSPTPTVPPSALACFFLGVIGLPKTLYRSASRWYPRTRFFRGLVLEVADISLCSGLRVCSPPRSLLPLRIFPQGSRGFYIRAYRASLPPHAPDRRIDGGVGIGIARKRTLPCNRADRGCVASMGQHYLTGNGADFAMVFQLETICGTNAGSKANCDLESCRK